MVAAPDPRSSGAEHPCVSVEADGARFALYSPTPFSLELTDRAYKLLLPFGVAALDVTVGPNAAMRLRTRPGDLVMAEPGSGLRLDHVAPLEFLVIELAPDRVRKTAEAAVGAKWQITDLAPWHDGAVAALGAEMRRTLIGEGMSPVAYLCALADALTTRVVVHLFTHETRKREDALAPATLARVLRHIDGTIADPISGAELARLAGLSQAHFARAFAKATGDPPHRFVIKRRVCRARDLLSAGEVSIAEIAARTGFSSQAHLSTAFLREVGISPAKYRAAFRLSAEAAT